MLLVAFCNSSEFAAGNNLHMAITYNKFLRPPLFVSRVDKLKGLPVNTALVAPQLSLIDLNRCDLIIIADFTF